MVYDLMGFGKGSDEFGWDSTSFYRVSLDKFGWGLTSLDKMEFGRILNYSFGQILLKFGMNQP